MLERKSWMEFKDTKLLWWINRSLHLFGWVIVYDMNSDGTISEVYPARTSFRGFEPIVESEGFIELTEYLKNNVDILLKEIKE